MSILQQVTQTLWRVASGKPGLVGQVVALAGGILLVVFALRARRGSSGLRASITQDGAYVAARAFISLPLTIALLAGLRALVTRCAPGLQTGWLPGLPVWLELLVYFVLMDALAYSIHRAFHAIPWLWHFHAVHHSQRQLNAFTTTRIHLVELLAKRVLMWAPLAVLGEPTETLAWLVALDGFWGFLVHSGFRIPLGPLRYVIVEPGYHLLHHSRRHEEQNSNYAERLVLWDLLLGAARFHGARDLSTGIDDPAFPAEQSAGWVDAIRTWCAQFAYPFRKLREG